MINKHKPITLFIKLFAFALLLSSCMQPVRFSAEYDSFVDNTVNELHINTTDFIGLLRYRLNTDAALHENNQAFYSDAYATIETLIIRAEFLEEGLEKTPLSDNFKSLREQYQDLENLHKTVLNDAVLLSATESFNQSFRAVTKHIIYLKWNSQ